MDVTPLITSDQQVVQSYKGGQFKISGAVYDHAVLMQPDRVSAWDVTGFDALTLMHFDAVKTLEPEIVLLGTGAKMQFLDSEMRAALKGIDLTVDAMDTSAACRTYNVLMAEGRQVVAALLPFV